MWIDDGSGGGFTLVGEDAERCDEEEFRKVVRRGMEDSGGDEWPSGVRCRADFGESRGPKLIGLFLVRLSAEFASTV